MSAGQPTDGGSHPVPADVHDRLDALQRASEERRAELREIAAQLPEALSRRAILRRIAGDVRHAPEKGDIARRAVRKLGRNVGQAGRAVRRFVTRSQW